MIDSNAALRGESCDTVRFPFHFAHRVSAQETVMSYVSRRTWLMASLVTVLGIGGPLAHAVGEEEEPATDAARAFMRLDRFGAEELRKELRAFPEVGLDQTQATNMYNIVFKSGGGAPILPDVGPRLFGIHATAWNRPDWLAVSWRKAPDCMIDRDDAAQLESMSIRLRRTLRDSTSGTTLDAVMLRQKLKGDAADWRKTHALPAIVQLLQAESEPVRGLMIDLLSEIPGKEASIALARRALFEVSPALREQATLALRDRSASDYQAILIDGFRFPWTPVAEHAAETIAALNLKSAVGELQALTKESDPTSPFFKDGGVHVREVVKVNHLCNCMLCHSPSLSKSDTVRGRIPLPNEIPPSAYYQEPSGIFVRADTTYLRQDFSVVQPVSNHGKWPAEQRYDYLLRYRPATPQDAAQKSTNPQRTALDFALRELGQPDAPAAARSDQPPLRKTVKKAAPPKR